MDCKEFRELLDLYVDGELSPEASFAARAHREGCNACSRVEQRLARLRGAVKRTVTEIEPPAELERRVRNLARPGWRQVISGSFPSPVNDRSGIPIWRRRVAVPVPAFVMTLLAFLALGVWTVSTLPERPTQSVPASVRRASPAPALETGAGFDLTQFDRGERAAIYKVRATESKHQQ